MLKNEPICDTELNHFEVIKNSYSKMPLYCQKKEG